VPRYDAGWVRDMLEPRRRGSPTAEEIVAAIGIRPGDAVADVGCGPGFLTIPAARAAGPTGRVDAIDLKPSMLDLVRQQAALAGLTNVVTAQPIGAALPLPDRCANVVICALLLHDLDDSEAMLRELARVAMPEARLAIVEWVPHPGDPRPNRLPPEHIAQLLRGIGRAPGPVIPLPPEQYLVVGT
jgi:ubiquinone/menaquinone biosynthesis C-methylase UbiE